MADACFKPLTFHLVTFAIYAFTLFYDTYYLEVHPGRQKYGGRFKYLTFWNELIQTAFFAYSILNDIFGSNSLPFKKGKDVPKRSLLQKFRDLVAASIVFPVGVFVVITFWTIYAYDRELIFPKALDDLVPQWLNHVWHTSVILFLLIEKCIVYHHYPSRRKGLMYAGIFCSIYVVWIFWLAFWADIWVYPVLAVMTWPIRIIFCIGCISFSIMLYLLGELLTNTIWVGAADEATKGE